MANKKYPGDNDASGKLETKILKGYGPKTSSTTKAVNVGGVDRLTDTSKYTGSHRERFDENGNGKGLDGRYHTDPTTLKAHAGYVGGYKGMETYNKTH